MQQALLLDILQRRAAKLSGLMTDIRPVLPSLLASHNHALQNNMLQLLKVLLPAESDEAAGETLIVDPKPMPVSRHRCTSMNNSAAALFRSPARMCGSGASASKNASILGMCFGIDKLTW